MPIADVELVMMASTAILAAQHFPHEVDDWEGLASSTRPWFAWETAFCFAHIKCQHQILALGGSQPLGGALAVIQVPPMIDRLEVVLDNLAFVATNNTSRQPCGSHFIPPLTSLGSDAAHPTGSSHGASSTKPAAPMSTPCFASSGSVSQLPAIHQSFKCCLLCDLPAWSSTSFDPGGKWPEPPRPPLIPTALTSPALEPSSVSIMHVSASLSNKHSLMPSGQRIVTPLMVSHTPMPQVLSQCGRDHHGSSHPAMAECLIHQAQTTHGGTTASISLPAMGHCPIKLSHCHHCTPQQALHR